MAVKLPKLCCSGGHLGSSACRPPRASPTSEHNTYASPLFDNGTCV